MHMSEIKLNAIRELLTIEERIELLNIAEYTEMDPVTIIRVGTGIYCSGLVAQGKRMAEQKNNIPVALPERPAPVEINAETFSAEPSID
jgi:hypothetical protein